MAQYNNQAMRLLLIDDDSRFTGALKLGLIKEYDILECDHPKKINVILEKNRIDLLLCDFDFGSENIIKYIESQKKQIPIIVMTGKATRENVIDLLNVGVAGLIEKPVNLTQLKEKINKLALEGNVNNKIVLNSLSLNLDEDERVIEHDGKKEKLTPLEMKILNYFLKQPNIKIKRDELEKYLWSNVIVTKHTLDTHIGNLKRKAPPLNKNLVSIYGEGFLLKVYDKKS
jgi:DNA-binding response OmpR family regulator